MPIAAPASRRRRAVESFRSAAECIGTIEPGASLFAVTRGQFSMIDAILACLDQTGPAEVTLWTWTVAEYEIACMERLMLDERITGATLVIDEGARNKQGQLLNRWRATFGPRSIRYVDNHAKIATITTRHFRLLLRGSMNLNFNPRFEQFDLTEGGADYDLVRKIEAEIPILPGSASAEQVRHATRTGEAFAPEQLAFFAGVKVWAK